MSFDSLKFQAILDSLAEDSAKSIPLHWFDILESTNQTAWEIWKKEKQANINAPTKPLIVIAQQQTAGRGQWGRQWQSDLGGLYLSMALPVCIPANNGAHLTFLTAWGIATILQRYSLPVQIKWLNDLILEEHKLGGIKTETRIHQEKITQAVIGVGLNWTNPIPDTGINLQAYPTITSLEMLSAIAVSGILYGYDYYVTFGIESLLPAYLELLNSCGRSVIVKGCPGVVVGVTTTGELRVRLQSPGATTEIHLPPGSISLGYN